MSPHAKNDAAILAALAQPGWFEKRVEPKIHRDPNGCLIWTASLSHGYAQVALPRTNGTHTTARVSRVMWLSLGRSILEDHVLDHDGPKGCSNKACVDSEHVQMVTIAHNIAVTGNGFGAVNARKQVCPSGHDLEGDNLIPSQDHRACLQCNRDYARRRNEVVREAAACLGLAVRAYVRGYGWSMRTAEQVIRERRRRAA